MCGLPNGLFRNGLFLDPLDHGPSCDYHPRAEAVKESRQDAHAKGASSAHERAELSQRLARICVADQNCNNAACKETAN